jgi:hypothetical protein
MCPDVPYFIILLCLTPDDFTHQGESAASQWVNQTMPMHPVNLLSGMGPRSAHLYYFTLSNTRQFAGGECYQYVYKKHFFCLFMLSDCLSMSINSISSTKNPESEREICRKLQ